MKFNSPQFTVNNNQNIQDRILNVDLRLAKFDADIIRYFFTKNEIRKSRKMLLQLLIKYPSVFFIGKGNLAYLLMSFFPSFILRILKKSKYLSTLFKSK